MKILFFSHSATLSGAELALADWSAAVISDSGFD